MTVAQAVWQLRRAGFEFTRGRDRIHVSAPHEPGTGEGALLEVLRRKRDELFSLLAWPEECIEAEARCGHRDARLYPLLGHRVRTPRGDGRLLLVLDGVAQVELGPGASPSRFHCAEVRPIRRLSRIG